jgi:hypothetical protein
MLLTLLTLLCILLQPMTTRTWAADTQCEFNLFSNTRITVRTRPTIERDKKNKNKKSFMSVIVHVGGLFRQTFSTLVSLADKTSNFS